MLAPKLRGTSQLNVSDSTTARREISSFWGTTPDLKWPWRKTWQFYDAWMMTWEGLIAYHRQMIKQCFWLIPFEVLCICFPPMWVNFKEWITYSSPPSQKITAVQHLRKQWLQRHSEAKAFMAFLRPSLVIRWKQLKTTICVQYFACGLRKMTLRMGGQSLRISSF